MEEEDIVDGNKINAIDIDTFIEDTLVFNMQKYLKVKKKLVECSKEYRQYIYTISPRRQHSRIIDSLGLNPLDKMP